MVNKEFSSKEVEQLTRGSLPLPSEDMVGKYYKIPYDVVCRACARCARKIMETGRLQIDGKDGMDLYRDRTDPAVIVQVLTVILPSEN